MESSGWVDLVVRKVEAIEVVAVVSSSSSGSSNNEDDFSVGCDVAGLFEPKASRMRKTPGKPRKNKNNQKREATFFTTEVEIFEIALTVAPRDVHKKTRNGREEWVVNQKPKKNAEVCFRKLEENEKMEFRRAMDKEIDSYLSHEAVEIAKMHEINPERLLGMRWVLTWKPVENKDGQVIDNTAKARLIIKGVQDPDLLNIKRDAPTLSTASRNLLLSIAATNQWETKVGDIKTAFLNGDKTEAVRNIFADPPIEVRQRLNMKENEYLRVLKAIYGLLHAPRAWGEKLATELQKLGWKSSKLEPCVWKFFHTSEEAVRSHRHPCG